MSFATDLQAALQAAAVQSLGVGEVSINGRTVRWRTLDELMKFLNYADALVSRENGTRPRAAQINLG